MRIEMRDYHDNRHRTLIHRNGREQEVCQDAAGNWFDPRTFDVYTADLHLAWNPAMEARQGPRRDGGTINE